MKLLLMIVGDLILIAFVSVILLAAAGVIDPVAAMWPAAILGPTALCCFFAGRQR